MNKYVCEICAEPYGYVIPYAGREMTICKAHYDYFENLKNSIIEQLLNLRFNLATNRKIGE